VMWTACGRKRGNFVAHQKRKKLPPAPGLNRTSCAAGCAFDNALIRLGKHDLSTEMDRTC
jgi:hypothetical protein